jgi:hypothetical protein
MNGRNNENMKELFEKFMDAEQAQSCLEDVQKAEEILREHPAPEPDSMLIANIKAEIAMRLPARRTYTFKQIAYKAVSIAAALIILSLIGLRLFETDSSKSGTKTYYAAVIPTAIWEGNDITTDDEDLSIFTTEIEQIEEELLALQLGENLGNGDRSISELEMELVAINSDFWKE